LLIPIPMSCPSMCSLVHHNFLKLSTQTSPPPGVQPPGSLTTLRRAPDPRPNFLGTS
jgi:hypothetical protein